MGEIENKFVEFYSNIKSTKNIYEASRYLIKAYDYAKNVSNYYNKKIIREKIIGAQMRMPIGYILDVDANYDYDKNYINIDKVNINSFESKEKLLDYIAFMTRYYLVSLFKCVDINDVDVLNLCEIASKHVEFLCNKLNLDNNTIRIDPGFNEKYDLLEGHGYHYFNIVTIDNEKYLIDCTYKQFFDVGLNLLESMGIYGVNGCVSGIYMLQSESRIKTAENLLKDGWIKCSEENIKNYFDGFVLSYRNASYYDDLGYIDFSTPYTVNDYENFIFGDDDQGKHELIENLGYQKKLIRNQNIVFKTDESLLSKFKNK